MLPTRQLPGARPLISVKKLFVFHEYANDVL